MWDYSDRRDSTRISQDELHEAEIDECVRTVTNIKKKDPVPKIFGAVAFSKVFPALRYDPNLSRIPSLFHSRIVQCRIQSSSLCR
jgi:hypothetical protein